MYLKFYIISPFWKKIQLTNGPNLEYPRALKSISFTLIDFGQKRDVRFTGCEEDSGNSRTVARG